MPSGGTTARREPRSRLTERHVLALGLAVSGLLVVAAAVAAASALANDASPWAAIHLALAGAATVAIGAFMPHFAITLAGTRPRDARERLVALGLLGAGAIAVVIGVALVGPWLAGAGTGVMLVGVGLVAAAVIAPLRDPLARRHHVVTLTYLAALFELAAGITIGGLAAVGVPGVMNAWPGLRATHVWLGLFGAVSLTIFATLVYLAPTVLGARIRLTRWLLAGVIGMLLGPAIAAIGFGIGLRGVVLTGITISLIGAFGQVGSLVDVERRRATFSSEHDWRRSSVGHLLAGPYWFAAALAVALAEIVAGAPIRGWSIGHLAIPMIAGWMLQELIGSWTYLVPSVTPGSPDDHARQRRHLAVAARSRLFGLNAGVGLAWAGALAGWIPLLAAGAVVAGVTVMVSLALLLRALTAGQY
jgi:hypothetical protein